jgi:hypothetical protein
VQASYPLVETINEPLLPETNFPAQFFRVADLVHEAIMDGLPATKRYDIRSALVLKMRSSPQRLVLQGRPAI